MSLIKKFISLKRSYKIALIFILILLGRFVFHWLLPPSSPLKNGAIPLKVEVVRLKAEQKKLEIPISGRTMAHRRVEIRAETKGRILERVVQEGSEVQGGKPLMSLSIDERAAEFAEAQAVVEQRQLEFEAAQKLSKKSFKSPTNLARAKANLEAAQAKLKRIETTLRDTKIKAPFSGILEQYHVDQGDYVKEGDPVAIFVQTSPLKASFHVSEKQRLKLALNQPCKVKVAGQEAEGFISQIRSIADDKTKTFYGEVTLTHTPETFPLAEGLTAYISAFTPLQKIHIISPAHLSLSSDGILGIKVLSSKKQVQFLPIQVVKHTPTGLWITGLPDTFSLITIGHEFAKEGEIVNAVLKKSSLKPMKENA